MELLQIATEVTNETTTVSEALANTALGMGTVFIVLILISFVIYLLKFIPKLLGIGKKKSQEKAVTDSAPVVETAEEVVAPVTNDDTQIVAVIMAAIAAQMSEETGVPVAADGLVIRSIKKRTFSI